MKVLLLLIVLGIIIGCSSHTKNANENTSLQQEPSSIYTEDGEEITDVPSETDYDESIPISQYFKIETINEAYFLDNGYCVLDIDVKNIYSHKFTSFTLSAITYYKLKNSTEYRKSHAQTGSDIKNEYKRITNWQPNEIKNIKIELPSTVDRPAERFHRTPKEIFVELSCYAISIEDEPNGVFARFDLMDLWKAKQEELISKGQ
ncbi:hypothetical protein EDC17_100210 [Sphingobacterium alimentarium]|uniref:DUF4352 domain-containing protein n=1 Tax=Sphingobacterium alimentarium TaxID=797292 RepID=A0A4R3W169_9SPHI|nr:hypothetical protein [Sphingobacterium alimentarium]TCV20304.1 hypothetical protein EDC17_100210 [Sphingobacterium alimentarium]